MDQAGNNIVSVSAVINAPVELVWKYWTSPEAIIHWNNASEDWHTPTAENDLRVGGHFNYRMEARDGSAGFDFGGIYEQVVPHKYIGYAIGDGRKVIILFSRQGDETEVVETFETERTHSPEMQRSGWQSILDNFKQYVESQKQLSNSLS